MNALVRGELNGKVDARACVQMNGGLPCLRHPLRRRVQMAGLKGEDNRSTKQLSKEEKLISRIEKSSSKLDSSDLPSEGSKLAQDEEQATDQHPKQQHDKNGERTDQRDLGQFDMQPNYDENFMRISIAMILATPFIFQQVLTGALGVPENLTFLSIAGVLVGWLHRDVLPVESYIHDTVVSHVLGRSSWNYSADGLLKDPNQIVVCLVSHLAAFYFLPQILHLLSEEQCLFVTVGVVGGWIVNELAGCCTTLMFATDDENWF